MDSDYKQLDFSNHFLVQIRNCRLTHNDVRDFAFFALTLTNVRPRQKIHERFLFHFNIKLIQSQITITHPITFFYILKITVLNSEIFNNV